MIIQIRGTSGSGKSTAMMAVKERYETWYPRTTPNVRVPLYYVHEDEDKILMGNYETQCGGCDRLKDGGCQGVYDLVKDLTKEYGQILFLMEGLLLSHDRIWTKKMRKVLGHEIRIVFLTTPLETCISRIRKRKETGKGAMAKRELNTTYTKRDFNSCWSCYKDLPEIDGITCVKSSGDKTPSIVRKWVDEYQKEISKKG